ncbi:DUF5677 domain-containing protein [Pseudoalteromonas sp. SSDWG2]|uniref:DUF5677 domain-containing protein n=1 Tax=Pseudoalteromonas sp. SSDWG2 TaxID=3139391 RepID=UPI003BAB82BA
MSHATWKELNQLRYDAFSTIFHESLQEKYVALLMTRVTELCHDAIELIEHNRYASVPIIMRSALESYVDLMCLIKDPEYIKEMNKSFEIYNLKVNGQKHSKKELKKIWEKFSLAEESVTYNGLYADLCRSAHGNIETLIRDHSIEEKISIGHKLSLSSEKLYLNQIITLAATSLVEGLQFLKHTGVTLDKIIKIQGLAGSANYA